MEHTLGPIAVEQLTHRAFRDKPVYLATANCSCGERLGARHDTEETARLVLGSVFNNVHVPRQRLVS